MNKPLAACLITLVFVLAPAAIHAQIYKWTDEQGRVHFGDRPPADQATSEIKARISTYKAVSYEKSSINSGSLLKMYSAKWCGICTKAKQYFRANTIPFKEMDIDESRLARLEYERLNARGVPVLLYGDKRMNGFNEISFQNFYP
ncbi:MAG: DUF4124 domain-containing protein [Gammaproteobacteria bacterium]